ncbi:hypothetical protein B0H14DRAFT_3090508 [Mycena olivaceomarginata]|nr:hypothetical protein B0H14DRAFT_3090508 [Mycena olivaceomarginata]
MADKKAMSRALGAAFPQPPSRAAREVRRVVRNWRNRAQGPQFFAQAVHINNPITWRCSEQRRPSERVGNKNAEGGGGSGGGSVLVLPRDNHYNAETLHGRQRPREKICRGGTSEGKRKTRTVLVHALHQVKRWCREGREEVVIVPLEALNTLDLLKKGTSQLAQRARAASRILEAQRDDAFVPWDRIAQTTPDQRPLPRWVRRTVCCARWEVESTSTATAAAAAHATGTLVAHWAARAGLAVRRVAPSVPNPNSSAGGGNNKRGGGPSARPSSIGKVGGGSFTSSKGSLVERPAAALAMEGKLAVMEGKGTLALGKDIGRGAAGPRAGVVRVLARGERLDAGA